MSFAKTSPRLALPKSSRRCSDVSAEIAEMKLLVEDISPNGKRGQTALPAGPAASTPEMQRQNRSRRAMTMGG
jgi:hypothetical protein